MARAEANSKNRSTTKPLKKAADTPAAKSTKTNAATPNNSEAVDAYMAKLEHPLKAEIEMIRSIIKNARANINEQVKWNAPSFFYKEELVTFNPPMQTAAHVVFHHPNIVKIKTPLLEGDYKDRRMLYFHNAEEFRLNKPAPESIIQQLIEMIDK